VGRPGSDASPLPRAAGGPAERQTSTSPKPAVGSSFRQGSRLPTLRILYFAGLREALGLAEESIRLPPEVRTVGQLCAYLASRHRGYAARRDHIRVARNEAFARDDEGVADGDVIALIPPVAGG